LENVLYKKVGKDYEWNKLYKKRALVSLYPFEIKFLKSVFS